MSVGRESVQTLPSRLAEEVVDLASLTFVFESCVRYCHIAWVLLEEPLKLTTSVTASEASNMISNLESLHLSSHSHYNAGVFMSDSDFFHGWLFSGMSPEQHLQEKISYIHLRDIEMPNQVRVT